MTMELRGADRRIGGWSLSRLGGGSLGPDLGPARHRRRSRLDGGLDRYAATPAALEGDQSSGEVGARVAMRAAVGFAEGSTRQ